MLDLVDGFPPWHPIHNLLPLKIMTLQPLKFDLKKHKVNIMKDKDQLHWGDIERIGRNEEIRRKYEKKEVK